LTSTTFIGARFGDVELAALGKDGAALLLGCAAEKASLLDAKARGGGLALAD
jgi:hypothetical protein